MAARASITKAVQQCDVLLPIPLHPQRLAKRGYNQSLLLAQALRQLVHSRTALQRQQAAIHHNWLQRTRHTTPQSLLAPAERQRNMRNAFAVSARHAPQLQGKRVGVIGMGSSAMDSAGTALECGAASVDLIARRTAMPTINKSKGSGVPGLTHGQYLLPDAWKWRIRHYINAQQVPPPHGSTLRVSRHDNAFFNLGCAVQSATVVGDKLQLLGDTGHGPVDQRTGQLDHMHEAGTVGQQPGGGEAQPEASDDHHSRLVADRVGEG